MPATREILGQLSLTTCSLPPTNSISLSRIGGQGTSWMRSTRTGSGATAAQRYGAAALDRVCPKSGLIFGSCAVFPGYGRFRLMEIAMLRDLPMIPRLGTASPKKVPVAVAECDSQ